MINLDITNVRNFAPHYLSYMKDRVLDKINTMSLSRINPFTSLPIKSMLDNNGVKTPEFIEVLLSENLEDICSKYPEVDNYLLSCKFVFYSGFRVRKELKRVGKTGNTTNIKDFRKLYVSKYDNPWINSIIRKHNNYFEKDESFKQLVNEVKSKINFLNETIGEIINYELIKKEERHILLYNFGVEVCPYCNRNYISKYKRNGILKTTADLDHFYPKTGFPLFSLSLHNFVPSCQICNSRFKLAKGVEVINPYNEKINYNQFKFSHNLNYNSDASIFFNENNKFDIRIECKNERYLNNIELFELEKLYNTHKSLVAEIVYKKEAYNKSYQELFKNLFKGMDLTEAEINHFLYGINMDESTFYRKPLSKLIYDIVNDD